MKYQKLQQFMHHLLQTLETNSTDKKMSASLAMSSNSELIVPGPDEPLLAYLKPAFTGWIEQFGWIQGSYFLASAPLNGSGPENAPSPC